MNTTSIITALQPINIEVLKVDENFALVVGKAARQQGLSFVAYRYGLLVCEDSTRNMHSRSSHAIGAASGTHRYACGCCTYKTHPTKRKKLLKSLMRASQENNIECVGIRLPQEWQQIIGSELSLFEIADTDFSCMKIETPT